MHVYGVGIYMNVSARTSHIVHIGVYRVRAAFHYGLQFGGKSKHTPRRTIIYSGDVRTSCCCRRDQMSFCAFCAYFYHCCRYIEIEIVACVSDKIILYAPQASCGFVLCAYSFVFNFNVSQRTSGIVYIRINFIIMLYMPRALPVREAVCRRGCSGDLYIVVYLRTDPDCFNHPWKERV